MLVIILALVIVCGEIYLVSYSMGRHSPHHYILLFLYSIVYNFLVLVGSILARRVC